MPFCNTERRGFSVLYFCPSMYVLYQVSPVHKTVQQVVEFYISCVRNCNLCLFWKGFCPCITSEHCEESWVMKGVLVHWLISFHTSILQRYEHFRLSNGYCSCSGNNILLSTFSKFFAGIRNKQNLIAVFGFNNLGYTLIALLQN